MDFSFVVLRVTLRLDADAPEPYALFVIKAEFEAMFRQAAGCSSSECAACPAPGGCLYHQTFAKDLSSDPAALKRFQKPTVPFIFDISRLPPIPNRGTLVHVGLTLVGTAANQIPTYLSALHLLFNGKKRERSIAVTIVKMESLNYCGAGQTIMADDGNLSADGIEFLSFQGLQQTVLISSSHITIKLLSPLRLFHDGRSLRKLSFSSFIRPLIRRVTSLAYYYGGIEMELDFKWLATESSAIESDTDAILWRSWGEESPGGRWDGLLGRGGFRGNLTDFHPFLLFGEYVHLGKGATFGFGRYQIDKNV